MKSSAGQAAVFGFSFHERRRDNRRSFMGQASSERMVALVLAGFVLESEFQGYGQISNSAANPIAI